MGKMTKQAANARRHDRAELERDANNYISDMAERMSRDVIAGLMSMKFWRRVRFALTLVFMPVWRRAAYGLVSLRPRRKNAASKG
jgi:hypothetical protein